MKPADDIAQLEALIIERAIYHLNAPTTSFLLCSYADSEHNAVTYAVRELINLASRNGVDVADIDIESIVKKLRHKHTEGKERRADDVLKYCPRHRRKYD